MRLSPCRRYLRGSVNSITHFPDGSRVLLRKEWPEVVFDRHCSMPLQSLLGRRYRSLKLSSKGVSFWVSRATDRCQWKAWLQQSCLYYCNYSMFFVHFEVYHPAFILYQQVFSTLPSIEIFYPVGCINGRVL